MDRLAKIRLGLNRFLTLMGAFQSVKQPAAFSARFDIRLVNRNADQRRPRSSALRLVGRTLRVLFTPRRSLPGQFRRPHRICVCAKSARCRLSRTVRAVCSFRRCSWYETTAASVANISPSKARSSNGVLGSVTIPPIVGNSTTLSCEAGTQRPRPLESFQ
jgi:hypothetical protein